MLASKGYVLSSGHLLTSSYTYSSKFTTRGFPKVVVTFDLVEGGSGANYAIRGYPLQELPLKTAIASGQLLLSGVLSYVQISGTYDAIDVGLQEAQTDESGAVTVLILGATQ